MVEGDAAKGQVCPGHKNKCPLPAFPVSATPTFCLPQPCLPPGAWGSSLTRSPSRAAPWASSSVVCERVCCGGCGEEEALARWLWSVRAGAIGSWRCGCKWNWAGERLIAVWEREWHIPPCQPRARLCRGEGWQTLKHFSAGAEKGEPASASSHLPGTGVWGVDKRCPTAPAHYHCNGLRGWALSPLGADKNHLSPKQECFMLSV